MELLNQSGNIACAGASTEFTLEVSEPFFFTKCYKTVGDVEVFPTVQTVYDNPVSFKVIFENGELEVGEQFYIKCFRG